MFILVQECFDSKILQVMQFKVFDFRLFQNKILIAVCPLESLIKEDATQNNNSIIA